MGESERFFACCRFQLIWFQWKQKKQREREREREMKRPTRAEKCVWDGLRVAAGKAAAGINTNGGDCEEGGMAFL